MCVDKRLEIEYLKVKYEIEGFDTDIIDWELLFLIEHNQDSVYPQ